MKTKTEKIGTLVMNSLAGSSGQPMQPNDSFQAPAKSSTGWLMVCKSMLGTDYLKYAFCIVII